MTNENKKSFGDQGESIACKFLAENGYKIVKRNYRFGKGEIDIIAMKEKTLVFVEVKTRNNQNYGPAESAITVGKQKQIHKIAQAFLYENDFSDYDCRIDVIAINYLSRDKYVLNHIVNAF
jgi:putative endonuclease